jgi:hypothetical protein
MKAQKKINLIISMGAGVGLLFIAAVFIINRSIEHRLEVQIQANKGKVVSQPSEAASEPVKLEESRPLIASELSGYQIIPQRLNRMTSNQRYWDTTTKKAVEASGVFARMEQGGTFKGATMTPVQFQRQLQRIDGRIEEYEQIVSREPDNAYAQKKLNDLYMLKSSMDALKKNMVEQY